MRGRNSTRELALATLIVVLATPGCGRKPPAVEPADTIFVNGGIYTVDAKRSWAEAAAVRDGRIVAVGSNEQVLPLKGENTRVVDLAGRMALPGFHDSHIHVHDSGLEQMQCVINDLETVEETLEVVKGCAARTKDEWIIGGGWWASLFDHRGPRKEVLDAAVPGRAVFLYNIDEHSAWVSSRALELSGITASTPDPVNGVIERDPKTGEPTGTLREEATDLVLAKAPQPTPAMRVAGLERGLMDIRKFGITSFIEADVEYPAHFEAFKSVADDGNLTAKVMLSLTYPPQGGEEFERLLARRQELSGPRLRADAVKMFLDGVLEGETAALLAPYLNRPGHLGELQFSISDLNSAVTRFDAMGLQVHMHAIGDAATRAGLDAIAAARAANGVRDNRHHMAHLQMIDPADLPRFAALGVTANFTPLWAYPDEYIVDVNTPQLGPERINRVYPIASILRAGGRVVFGSDWSVNTENPLPSIEVALRRMDPWGHGTAVLNENERVDLATIIAAYTIEGAWLMHQEHDTGSIEVGKAADIVVLERDLFKIPSDAIDSVRVDLTMLDGTPIYERGPR